MFQLSRRGLVRGAAGHYAALGLSKALALIGAAETRGPT